MAESVKSVKDTRSQTQSEAVLESKYVHDVYDEIASHFSSTRYKPWPNIEAFIQSFPLGSCWADVGCGNGKYMGINSDNAFCIGSDRALNFITILKERKLEGLVADSLSLPFRPNSFDYVISIAVIHHFASIERRTQAIRELRDICKVGGRVLVYVWAKEQQKKRITDENNDVFVAWHLQKNFQRNKETADEEKVYQRYYHLFEENELEGLFLQAGDLKIISSGFDKENWFTIAERVA